MLVILELGYNKYTFPKEVIPFLDKIQQVEEKMVNRKIKYFIKDEDTNKVKAVIITDDQLVQADTPEEQENFKALYAEKEKANSDLYSRLWKEEEATKKLKAELDAMKALCPDSHKKEE